MESKPLYLTNIQVSDALLGLQIKQLAGFSDDAQPSVEEVHAALMGIDCLESAIDAAIALGDACKRLKTTALSTPSKVRTPHFPRG